MTTNSMRDTDVDNQRPFSDWISDWSSVLYWKLDALKELGFKVTETHMPHDSAGVYIRIPEKGVRKIINENGVCDVRYLDITDGKYQYYVFAADMKSSFQGLMVYMVYETDDWIKEWKE